MHDLVAAMKKASSASDISVEANRPRRQSISYIPVITPRRSQSSIPSTPMSALQYGLVPPPRHLSVSGSPSRTPVSSLSAPLSPTPPSTFRSFKNLLSFGPSKPSLPTPSSIPRNSFGFSSIRRTSNVERSPSTPAAHQSDDSPILSIDLPQPGSQPLMEGIYFATPTESDSLLPKLPSYSKTSAPSLEDKALPPDGLLILSDLSTILESETSGVLRHVPFLEYREEQTTLKSSTGAKSISQATMNSAVAPLSARLAKKSPPTDPHFRMSLSTSALDVSGSKVTDEVLEALAGTGSKDGWLNDVVVEDNAGVLETSLVTSREVNPDISLDLDSLDPDLAALLSPYNGARTDPALINATNALPTPALTPPLSSETDTIVLGRAKTETHSAHTSVKALSPQPSPTNAAFSSGRSPGRHPPALPRNPPSAFSTLPRLSRSSSDRPPALKAHAARESTGRAMSLSPERPSAPLREAEPDLGLVASSSRSTLPRRPQTGDIPIIPATTALSSRAHKPDPLRLTTQNRPQTASDTAASRLAQSRLQTSQTSQPGKSEPSSPSTSRAPSSAGFASSSSRLQGRTATGRLRVRDRSHSFTERGVSPETHCTPRLASDLLGPRTAKAFAAAGLLPEYDRDREPEFSTRWGAPSRFGTSRSSVDDSRSRYVLSRVASSEIGRNSSWGRRQRGRSISEASGPLSESVSTPRTTFSANSTAATSVSAASRSEAHLQSEIQQLQEKHTLETGALLNALADSQRTTRVLRDENAELRERLADLEDRLARAVEEIQRMQYTPPSRLSSSKAGHSRLTSHLSATSMDSRVRPRQSTARDASFDLSFDEQSSPTELAYSMLATPSDVPVLVDGSVKRLSASSSIFPLPPSNMSMIMHEDNYIGRHSMAFSLQSESPPSPTLAVPKLNGNGIQSRGSRHVRNSSISSGNISPTTANFSMMTRSPGSLQLRPEHEQHLGDMPSLSLYLDDDVESVLYNRES